MAHFLGLKIILDVGYVFRILYEPGRSLATFDQTSHFYFIRHFEREKGCKKGRKKMGWERKEGREKRGKERKKQEQSHTKSCAK